MPESKSRQCSGSADTDLSTLEAPDDHANAISADPMWKIACAGHGMDICQPSAIVFRSHGLIKPVCANCATTGRSSSSWHRLPRVWHACVALLRDHERLQAAGTQPASQETEGCSGRFSEIWQSRHTIPMIRANKMQSNLCSNRRHAPCPTSKHAAKWARPKKSPTGFAAGAFWRLVPAGTSGNLALVSPKCTCCGMQKDHVVTTHRLCNV